MKLFHLVFFEYFTSKDHVYDQEIQTQQIFDDVVKNLITSSLQGINATVFAYGQTASGKTHTVRGTDVSPGLIPLSIKELFSGINSQNKHIFKVTVSFFELYNETINDLLEPANQNLDIRENYSGIYIKGLSEKIVNTPEQALEFLKAGDLMKKVGETKLNDQSSRSHTVFRMCIESKPVNADPSIPTQISQLNLVDLAGSEALSRTKAEGIRRREGMNINKSLLALSNVIQKLSTNPCKFINYRDSKLTRMLQPALGGNSKTAIICTVSKLKENYQETINTLLFGSKAKNIKNSVHINELITDTNVKLALAIKEIQNLKEQLMYAKSCPNMMVKSESSILDWERKVEIMRNELTQKNIALEAKDRILTEFMGIKNELNDANGQIGILQEKNEFLNREIIELRIENKEKQLEVDEKVQEIERLRVEIAKRDIELECLKSHEPKNNSENKNYEVRTYSLPVISNKMEIVCEEEKVKEKIDLANRKLTLEVERLNQNLQMELEEKLAAAREKDQKIQKVETALNESIYQNEKLLEELKEMAESKEKLQNEFSQILSNTQEKDNEISILKNQISQSLEEISQLKLTINSLQFASFPKNNGPSSMDIDQNEVILVEKQQNNVKRKSSYKDLEEQNKKLISDIDNLYTNIEEYKENIRKLTEERDELNEIVKSYESNTCSFKKEIERLQTENQGITMQLQGKFGRMQILEKEKNQLKNDLESYRSEAIKARSTLEKLTKENQKLKKDFEICEQRLKEGAGSPNWIKEKAEKIAELEGKLKILIEQLKNEKKEKDLLIKEKLIIMGKIKEIQNEKNEENEKNLLENKNIKEQCENIKNEKNLLEEINLANKKEIEILQNNIANLEEKNKSLVENIGDLNSKFEILENQKKNIETELSSYKDSLEIERRRFFSAIKQSENTNLQNVPEELKKEKMIENVTKKMKSEGIQFNYELEMGQNKGKRYYLRSTDKENVGNGKERILKENKSSNEYYIN